jgi:hypothetical protein
MKKTLKTSAALAALALATPLALAQPANDNCGGATPVTDGDNLVDTKLSTLDTQIPCNRGGASFSGPEVWYKYTAPTSGIRNFTITSFRRNSPTAGGARDSELTIYDACGGTILACDEDSGVGSYSKIYHFAVTAGTQYIIRVGNWGPLVTELNKGIGTLNISEPPAPVATEDCALAQVVSGQPLSVPFTTVGRVNSDIQGWDCEPFLKDGWFAWTPSVTGMAVVNGCAAAGVNNANGLMLGMNYACGAPPILCNSSPQDPPNEFCQSKLCFPVTAGQTYYVRYGVLFDTNDATGNMEFEVRPPNAPMVIPTGAITEPGNCSDNLANDPNVGCDGTPPRFTQIQLCETRQGTASTQNEPYYLVNGGRVVPGNDEDWYEFTLTSDQTITITGQSEFPPSTRLMIGCPPTEILRGAPWSPSCVASSYDLGIRQASGNPPFTASLIAGTYYFAVAPQVNGNSYSTCGHGDKYWFKITGDTPCPVTNQYCCRGTTCASVVVGACMGTSAGTTFTPVSSCGTGINTATCCFADYDHNGDRTIDDIFIYLNAWFASSPYTKFGGDGVATANIDDIFVYLNAWFIGCN